MHKARGWSDIGYHWIIRRDGTIEVHEGPEPGADPLVRSKILPGLTFDQVRIGASAGASLGLSRLTVRAVEATSAR